MIGAPPDLRAPRHPTGAADRAPTAHAAAARAGARLAARAPALWLALGAVVLRLLMFLGRGDYVAFDEAWYLILGRNLWSGHGYSLSGLRHVALSPLFPLVAGGTGRLVGDTVWGGRIVAAVAAGLLVLPCWSLFRRLGGRRVALLGCAIVAVLPSLAPFVTPELVGWDLWVGAGPLFMLFVFTGIAAILAAVSRRAPAGRSLVLWAAAGAAFGLAFLDRPEALIAAPLVVLAAMVLSTRRPIALAGAVVCAVGFLVPTAPYFLYLHDALGRWTLTGRGVPVGTQAVNRVIRRAGAAGDGTVESMLWDGNQGAYAAWLYHLDPSATRMADPYWGVPPRGSAGAPVTAPARPAPPPRMEQPTASAADSPAAAVPSVARTPAAPPPQRPSLLRRLGFFANALGTVLPLFLWPLALAGLVGAGRRRRAEAIAFVPLAVTSAAVSLVFAVDPRTQLFLAPALAWYTASGAWLLARFIARRAGPALRRDFLLLVLGGSAVALLLGIDARRLLLGLGGDAVHQVIGSANREVGSTLRRLVPPGESVMSWSPAPAVWAGRDWRPLPIASMADVMTFAAATHTHWIVFTTLNPSPLSREQMPKAFLIARVLPGVGGATRWSVTIESIAGQHAVGVLGPAATSGAPWRR